MDDLRGLSIKELRALIGKAGLTTEGCVDKSDLLERAAEAQEKLASGGGTGADADPEAIEAEIEALASAELLPTLEEVLKSEASQSTALRAKKTSTREEELEVDLTGDYGNVALLLLLYTLQGIPMGLTGAVSLSLASQKGITMDQQGMFSLVSWPFSLKLLWAPIVDSLFVERFGRRKTWLVPTQLLIAAALVAMSPFVDLWLAGDADSGIAPDVLKLTSVFFLLFFLCATQDICVDGWALTLLSKRNVGYASTCNAIGQTLGNLLSYVGWIACE